MDNKIKDVLEQITEGYSPSEQTYKNIVNELKGENYMKEKINIRKFTVCFAAAALLLSTGVVASQFAAYTWSSSNITDKINHAPSRDEVAAEVDYEPKYAQQIGDYTLVSAQPCTSGASDEHHNKISKTKDINFDYEKDGKRVTLFTNANVDTPYKPSPATVKAGEVNGITLYYNKTINKFLPPDEENSYIPTPEEEKQMAEGTLNIAYGSSKVEINISEYLAWDENGVHYGLLTMDNELGQETLVSMAADIINS